MFSSDKWFGSTTGFYPESIDQSLRFEDGDSPTLARTPGSAGNRRTFTISFWFKRGNLGSFQELISAYDNSSANNSAWFGIAVRADDTFTVNGWNNNWRITNRLFRDTTNWYHAVVVVNSTLSTENDRIKIYINGIQETSFSSTVNENQNHDYGWNNTIEHRVGSVNYSINNYYFDGYIAEVNNLDGTAIGSTSRTNVETNVTEYVINEFGEFKNNIWIPKAYSGSYGANGFRLTFADSSDIGNNANSTDGTNDFTTVTNINDFDVVPDSPTNNFAVLNPIAKRNSSTLSQGNLRAQLTGGGDSCRTQTTFALTSGKWYFEVRQNSSNRFAMGVLDTNRFVPNESAPDGGTSAFEWVYVTNDNAGSGARRNNGTLTNGYGATTASGEVIMVALDVDNGAIWFGKENSWFNNGTSDDSATVKSKIEAGLTTNSAYTSVTGSLTPVFIRQTSNDDLTVNFGQDDTFQTGSGAGETSAGNTDSNGQGSFLFAPPNGFLAICSNNLSDTTLSPNKSENADDYFSTKLYDGNGGTNAITGVGFQPDWVWSKRRNASASHNIWDSVRGATKLLFTDAPTIVEKTLSGLTSFDPDGFTMGSEVTFSNNINLSNYVAWNWRAGGSPSSNTDGGIASSVSVSKEAGFSIVTYTGTGSASTVGHGLDFAPTFIMVFSRDVANSTVVGSTAINGWSHYISLANSGFSVSDSSIWNNTAPTTEVFSVGTADNTNKSTNTFVAYCFHDIEGYSKFNKFTGGGTFFPYVHLGFRPAYVMIKRTNTSGGWTVFDDTRNTTNSTDLYLGWDGSFEEKDGSTLSPAINIDFTSNGFKVRSTENVVNSSGGTFLYFAFARQPFKFSNAR